MYSKQRPLSKFFNTKLEKNTFLDLDLCIVMLKQEVAFPKLLPLR